MQQKQGAELGGSWERSAAGAQGPWGRTRDGGAVPKPSSWDSEVSGQEPLSSPSRSGWKNYSEEEEGERTGARTPCSAAGPVRVGPGAQGCPARGPPAGPGRARRLRGPWRPPALPSPEPSAPHPAARCLKPPSRDPLCAGFSLQTSVSEAPAPAPQRRVRGQVPVLGAGPGLGGRSLSGLGSERPAGQPRGPHAPAMGIGTRGRHGPPALPAEAAAPVLLDGLVVPAEGGPLRGPDGAVPAERGAGHGPGHLPAPRQQAAPEALHRVRGGHLHLRGRGQEEQQSGPRLPEPLPAGEGGHRGSADEQRARLRARVARPGQAGLRGGLPQHQHPRPLPPALRPQLRASGPGGGRRFA